MVLSHYSTETDFAAGWYHRGPASQHNENRELLGPKVANKYLVLNSHLSTHMPIQQRHSVEGSVSLPIVSPQAGKKWWWRNKCLIDVLLFHMH